MTPKSTNQEDCKHIMTHGYRPVERGGLLYVQVDCDDCGKTLEADAFEPIPPFPLKPGQRAIQALPESWKIDGRPIYHGGSF